VSAGRFSGFSRAGVGEKNEKEGEREKGLKNGLKTHL